MPEITLRVNGRALTVPAGTTAAVALAIAGLHWSRRSVTGELRGPLCGMGICFECRATVNGVPHVRTCQLMCESGMEIRTGD